MTKKIVYVRLKKGQQSAIKIGGEFLYPNGEKAFRQNFTAIDSNDPVVKKLLEKHKNILEVKTKRPKESKRK